MGRVWATSALLLGLVASVQLAAVPTQDTLVISRADVSTPAAEATTEVTSEEPNAPIQLKEMHVNSDISLRYAHTSVVTHVKNPAKKAQETTFRVLLPETAFISGFTMTLDGKAYKAYVKKKEEAKNIFNNAVSQGFGAALIGAKARDSNHFTVSVNVEPNTLAIFNLTYEELLVRRNGVYNHAINLHPGTVVPTLKVKVNIKETEKIKDLRVPEVRTGNEIDARPEDAQNPNAVIERTHDDREAIISFSPDLEEQKRLMDVYAAKSKESQNYNRGYSYYGEDNKRDEKAGVLGQFVVQYDVDRPANGEVLVNDGYFVHFYAPSNLPTLNKHVVFVLDTSGSMSGHKIEQLHEAMSAILTELNEGDYFNIVEFSNGVTVHDLSEADKEVPPTSYNYNYYMSETKDPKLVAPSPATKANIAKAKIIVQRLDAAGGTNIAKALDVAVKLVKQGLEPKVNKTENLEATTEKPTEVTQATTTPSVGKKLEPIIIFLTDGEATVGDTNPTHVINIVAEKNYGESQASIYSLAFGEDADRGFLRKLSLRNAGFMRHIYEAADAALQLRHFYREVASPLLSHVHFKYPENQVKGVTKTDYKVIYDGSEILVAGQYTPVEDAEFTPTLSAYCGVVDAPGGRKKYATTPKVSVIRKKEELPLERLWAYLTIKQLLDQRDAEDKQDTSAPKPDDKALEIALKYEFVTPLTSLVVVKPNATNAVDPESVDKERLPSPVAIGNYGPPGAPAFSSMLMQGPGYAVPAYSSGVPLSLSSGGFAAADSYPLIANTEAFLSEDVEDEGSRLRLASLISPPRPAFSGHYRLGGAGGALYSRLGFAPSHKLSFEASVVNTRRPQPTVSMHPSTTPRPDPLAQWRLERYSWARSLLNVSEEALEVTTANGTVLLKLSSSSDVPKLSSDEDCARTAESQAGSCVYLTRCDLPDTFTSQTYTDTYCSVTGYAGVCCPKDKIDLNKSR